MKVPEFQLRPVQDSDLDSLVYLVGTIADGITSLPNNPDYLTHRINDSLRAFDPRIHKPGGETYLFVLERLSDKKLIGTSGLLSKVGGFDPFYTYRIEKSVQEYPPLDIRLELEILQLTKNHKGPTEICSLFLHRDFRSGGLGRLLSLSRFCFMQTFPARFDTDVIAELRGYLDREGNSPFWEAVGKKFFEKDYYTADILSGLGDKEFIEALMPKYPIYISLLPKSAREVIGRVHPNTEPARHLLLKEGFHETNEVDIFDAGPLLRAKRDELNAWKQAKVTKIKSRAEPQAVRQTVILTNRSLDFRAVMAETTRDENGCLMAHPETLDILKVTNQDEVVCLPF